SDVCSSDLLPSLTSWSPLPRRLTARVASTTRPASAYGFGPRRRGYPLPLGSFPSPPLRGGERRAELDQSPVRACNHLWHRRSSNGAQPTSALEAEAAQAAGQGSTRLLPSSPSSSGTGGAL